MFSESSKLGAMTNFKHTSKRAVALALAFSSAATTAAISAAPAQAQLPTQQDVDAFVANTQREFSNFVLQQRDNIHAGTENLPPEVRDAIRFHTDNFTNFITPGALAARAAAIAAEEARVRAEEAARQEAARQDAIRREEEARRAAANPCPAWARACVDIDGRRSWLQNNGQIVYGPVVSSSGGIGQETPRGTFTISRKVKDEISYEFNNAPMPWAVYFTNNGHAFHQGSTARTSAGCVRLDMDSARIFFHHLNPGDKIFIY